MKTLQALLIGFVLAWVGPARLPAADYYVDITNVSGHAHPYTSWATAATNIQFAVNEAGAGDTVWVRPGQYTAPTNAVVYNGVTNVVHLAESLGGITLRGDGPREQIVIDGEGTNRCVMTSITSYDATDYETYTIQGITISNGWAAADGGGGIYCSLNAAAWNLVLDDCLITHNRAAGAGGGIHAYGVGTHNRLRLTVTNSVLRNNESTTVGGAMYLRMKERSIIVDSFIQDNRADDGAALYVYGGHDIERCVFSGNVAAGDGGVLAGIPLGMVFRNCLLYANRAIQGGAIYLSSGGRKVDIYSSTIASNRAGAGASAAIHLSSTDNTLWMNNSILALNFEDRNLRDPGAVLAVSNNCSPELVGIGTDNIGGDPGFVDAAGTDFHLTTASPCLNEGLNEDWMIGATDLDGNPRLDGKVGIVDMGCYERLYRGTMVLIQ